MLRRKIYSELVSWKKTPGHKALVVRGQRQVGKTFIIREFARNEYRNLVEIDFTKDIDLRAAFEGNLRVDDIIRGLSAYRDPKLFVPGETLLFFDEIQDFPPAWSSLKSFTEDGRYDVIASGSLLGIRTNIPGEGGDSLLPTGYQTFLTMKPLDFEEFLWACGIGADIVDEVRDCLNTRKPTPPVFHSRLSELFREYLIVGGMPESVKAYCEDRDYTRCSSILEDLLAMCHEDINRYNRGVDRIKTAQCFDSIPLQLSNTNKKFMYSRVEGDGSRRSGEKYRSNILWIIYAGLGIRCRNLTQLAKPLKSNAMEDAFRTYLSDTGLLTVQYGLPAVAAIRKGDNAYNCGAVIENQVAVCLDQCGFDLYYYRKNSGKGKMEIDFVIETFSGTIVVEVKSGKTRDAPSIRKVPKFFKVDGRVVLEDGPYHEDDEGIEHMPLYAAAFFDTIWNGGGTLNLE